MWVNQPVWVGQGRILGPVLLGKPASCATTEMYEAIRSLKLSAIRARLALRNVVILPAFIQIP